MNYLSSELESTTFGHYEAAAAALESTTSGGDENACGGNENAGGGNENACGGNENNHVSEKECQKK